MRYLKKLKISSYKLYCQYMRGDITLENYVRTIKPLDMKIDQLELKTLNDYLVDNLASQIASLKHPR